MSKQGSFFGTHFSETKDKTPQTEAKDLPPSQPLEKSFAAVVSPPSSLPTGTPATVKEIPATADKQQDPVVFTRQQKALEENEIEIGIEIVESVTEISFMDPTIQADLPPYEKVTAHPNKDYNNVDKVTFTRLVNRIYEATVTWKKNFFLLPSGQCGKDFIKLLIE